MKALRPMLKHLWSLLRMMPCLLCVASLPACGSGDYTWQEEALLHDGKVLLVERTAAFRYYGEIVQMGKPHSAEWRVSFTHPATGQKIAFENNGDLDLMMIDFDRGVPFLIGTPAMITDYNDYGCPTPPYVAYHFDTKQWQRVDVEQIPQQFTMPNLMLDFDLEELKGMVSHSGGRVRIKQVQEYYGDRSLAEYLRKIDRRIRNPASIACDTADAHYGPGASKRFRNTGTWLDKTPEEARKLLWGDSK